MEGNLYTYVDQKRKESERDAVREILVKVAAGIQANIPRILRRCSRVSRLVKWFIRHGREHLFWST